ncbi:MAG: hypothetical protein F4X92_04865 [Gammaproteobacteria bacterium]|nr:hypothetical protein [Gammaproteobacteria bacterium]
MRGIVCVSRGERKGHGCPGIRGSHVKPGISFAPGLSDALGAVFFRVPVPSGGTLMPVLSRPNASTRTLKARPALRKTA